MNKNSFIYLRGKCSIRGLVPWSEQGVSGERIAKRNKFLSEKRAEVVAEAIVNAGINKDRIITEYFGDTVNPFETPEENRVAVCLVK